MDFLRLPYIFHHKLAGYIDGMDVYTRFRFSRSCRYIARLTENSATNRIRYDADFSPAFDALIVYEIGPTRSVYRSPGPYLDDAPGLLKNTRFWLDGQFSTPLECLRQVRGGKYTNIRIDAPTITPALVRFANDHVHMLHIITDDLESAIALRCPFIHITLQRSDEDSVRKYLNTRVDEWKAGIWRDINERIKLKLGSSPSTSTMPVRHDREDGAQLLIGDYVMDFLDLPQTFHRKLAKYIDAMDVYTRFRFSRTCRYLGKMTQNSASNKKRYQACFHHLYPLVITGLDSKPPFGLFLDDVNGLPKNTTLFLDGPVADLHDPLEIKKTEAGKLTTIGIREATITPSLVRLANDQAAGVIIITADLESVTALQCARIEIRAGYWGSNEVSIQKCLDVFISQWLTGKRGLEYVKIRILRPENTAPGPPTKIHISEDGQRLVASCNLRPAVRNRYLPKEYCLSVKPEEPTSA